ncbi:FAD dependent oxidoreductase [Neolentinus lepideus HHB14362 ss-1]|uniref:FAD dependent oxidoreductase n=1 Tax=Neolentinus lepideus HHB14362 ss-1 TaxID=1314782 RepID=A0A165RAZ4_9AGAM|nr:FAD dependent oxidoreductase [Neolentinus lepideus HHB14362 ss-1]
MVDKNSDILILGAGCFGSSTAYHLLKRGFTSITIADRSEVLPALDAASTDYNRIVRSSYSDPFYSRLAREAIAAWRDTSEWDNVYHESGVLVLGTGDSSYIDQAYANDVSMGARTTSFRDAPSLRAIFTQDIAIAYSETSSGYLNYDGGWADAAKGTSLMISKIAALGARILPGKTAKKLLKESEKTIGAEFTDGTVVRADLVIVATGSWTTSIFPELDFGEKCLATGQSVAMIKLTPAEADEYRNCPVVLDFKSGFYMFPPNEDNIIKMAMHVGGYTNFDAIYQSRRPVSVPRTITSHGTDGLKIPKPMLKTLREHLRAIYPELAEMPFSGTRLCWYSDTPDEDWVIGHYPGDDGLMFATGGSGHAYKFLPVIGSLVADAVTGQLDPSLKEKFAFDRECKNHDLSRSLLVLPLRESELCTADDLLPR